MVTRSRRIPLLRFGLLLLILFWLQASGATGLTVSLDKREATLGEPIQVRIVADTALNELDLSTWQTDLEVFSRAASLSSGGGQVRGVLDLTLYPLRSGTLALSPLHLGRRTSRALELAIAPSPLNFSTRIDPMSPNERQAATLTLQFQDQGELSFTPLQLDAPHIAWTALPESINNGAGLRILRWTILPLQSGGLSIRFPMLDAYRFGQRLRYPLAPINFRAARLPAYLPLYLPIGKPTVKVDALPAELIAGRPYNWNIEIDAPGLSPAGALKLVQNPKAPGLRFYTPRATTLKRDGREIIQLSLSFEAVRGNVFFPSLQIPYFEPATQTLRALSLPSQTLQVRDPALLKQLLSVLVALAILILVALGNTLAPRVQAWRQRRRWLKAIQTSADVTQLYRLLSVDAPWPSLSIRRWPIALRARIKTAEIDALETQRFGPGRAALDFIQLRQTWRNLGANLPLEFFKC